MFFSSQCTPISNKSVLPSNEHFITDKRLTRIKFNKDDILKIIRNLNVNKAHGHDDILIRMLKICDTVVTQPLSILLNNCWLWNISWHLENVSYYTNLGHC